jgi:hypothetical protein
MALPPSGLNSQRDDLRRAFRELSDHIAKRADPGQRAQVTQGRESALEKAHHVPSRPSTNSPESRPYASFLNVGGGLVENAEAGRIASNRLNAINQKNYAERQSIRAEQHQKLNEHISSRGQEAANSRNAAAGADRQAQRPEQNQLAPETSKESFRAAASEVAARQKQTEEIER